MEKTEGSPPREVGVVRGPIVEHNARMRLTRSPTPVDEITRRAGERRSPGGSRWPSVASVDLEERRSQENTRVPDRSHQSMRWKRSASGTHRAVSYVTVDGA
jgi:hypothetical protein